MSNDIRPTDDFGFHAQAGEPYDVTVIRYTGRRRARFKRLPSLNDPIVGYIIHPKD